MTFGCWRNMQIMTKAFQHHVLDCWSKAVHRGEARGKNLTYLTDRLAIAEGKPQLYGTQLIVDGCKIELHPIIDSL